MKITIESDFNDLNSDLIKFLGEYKKVPDGKNVVITFHDEEKPKSVNTELFVVMNFSDTGEY